MMLMFVSKRGIIMKGKSATQNTRQERGDKRGMKKNKARTKIEVRKRIYKLKNLKR